MLERVVVKVTCGAETRWCEVIGSEMRCLTEGDEGLFARLGVVVHTWSVDGRKGIHVLGCIGIRYWR